MVKRRLNNVCFTLLNTPLKNPNKHSYKLQLKSPMPGSMDYYSWFLCC